MRGALTSLNVFERDIKDLFAFCKGVPNIAEHLLAGGTNIDFPGGHAERAHELARIGQCQIAGGKTWHRVAKIFFRGSPIRSIVLAATIKAWVESRPPE